MLNIAICLRNYFQQAVVTLVSVLENTTGPIAIHVLHDETLLPHRDFMESIVHRYGHSIQFYNVETRDFDKEFGSGGAWGKGALYRLVLHEYIDAKTVLYLDCDIVANRDLAPLASLDLQGRRLAAVKDPCATRMKEEIRRLKKLGLPAGTYFNSGVLLIDVEWLRSLSADFQKEIAASLHAGHSYPDQDALNFFYAAREDSVLLLDEVYNTQINYATQDLYFKDFNWYKNRVIHYATPKKPWSNYSLPSLFYWKYYSIAFPGEDIFSCIEHLEQHKFNELCSLAVASPFLRGMLRRKKDIMQEGLWCAIRKRVFPRSIRAQ